MATQKSYKRAELRIGGMYCAGCQTRIEKKLRRLQGVASAEADYARGSARVTFDAASVSLEVISEAIEALGYRVYATAASARRAHRTNTRLAAGLLALVLALFVLLGSLGVTNLSGGFPLAKQGMGYGMVFLIGLLTSLHCVAMCGGISLTQCVPGAGAARDVRRAALRPSLQYNLGRVVSYTAIGAVCGALGSVITLTGGFKGIVQILAGAFMIVMGLSMFGFLPKLPKLSARFAQKSETGTAGGGRRVLVGLLNGLMPCGPLQAMQLYALSTGSPARGAAAMFFFSVGTLPLMFGLGALAAAFSRRFTARAMTVSAALVIFLGLFMASNGMALSGIGVPSALPAPAPGVQGADGAQEGGSAEDVQLVRSTLKPGGYPHITVKAGTPVRWIIDAPSGSLNGCNYAMVIPKLGIEYTFEEGENVIEFMPEASGEIPYSCWMGMIRSSITVEA